jgi:hypothetical protein
MHTYPYTHKFGDTWHVHGCDVGVVSAHGLHLPHRAQVEDLHLRVARPGRQPVAVLVPRQAVDRLLVIRNSAK